MSVKSKMTAIADEIRDKTGKNEAMNLDQMPSEIRDAYEAGKKAEYDAFWDAYQENGTRTNYAYAFAGQCWNPKTLKPKYPIAPKWGGAGMMFYLSAYNGSLKNIPLDFSQLTGMNYTFYKAEYITEIPLIDASNGTQILCDFYGCTSLTTLSLKVSEKITKYVDAFTGCTSLTNLTVEGAIAASVNLQHSPLTKASIINVINSLSASVTAQTLTIKKSAKEAAFTNDEWNALTSTKNQTG